MTLELPTASYLPVQGELPSQLEMHPLSEPLGFVISLKVLSMRYANLRPKSHLWKI